MTFNKNSFVALLATLIASSIFAGQSEGWYLKGDITLKPHSERQQLAQFEKKHENILTHAQALRDRQQYSACMDETQKIPLESSWYSKAQQLWLDCKNARSEAWLRQAKDLAAQGKYQNAIAMAQKIPEGKFSETARQLIDEWSLDIRNVAEKYCQQATEKLDRALSVASAIPIDRQARESTQIQSWQSARSLLANQCNHS